MRRELGYVIITGEVGPDRIVARWAGIRELALLAESAGFGTVWAPDELLWLPEGRPPLGLWECVAMLGALSAITSRVKVGSWVMSALHRNPGLTAKVAETLDEISGGRFLFGLGAGHAWPGQAHAFGLPEDHIYARFEEALEIIVPLLRGGRADFHGTWHAAHDLEQRPRGPRPGRIPIMLAGHGERGMRHAARSADIWSCYAEQRSDMTELGPRIVALESACAEVGRDPATIGRSAGVDVAPGAVAGAPGVPKGAIVGSSEEIAGGLRALFEGGYTQLECTVYPQTRAGVEAMAPVVELLAAD